MKCKMLLKYKSYNMYEGVYESCNTVSCFRNNLCWCKLFIRIRLCFYFWPLLFGGWWQSVFEPLNVNRCCMFAEIIVTTLLHNMLYAHIYIDVRYCSPLLLWCFVLMLNSGICSCCNSANLFCNCDIWELIMFHHHLQKSVSTQYDSSFNAKHCSSSFFTYNPILYLSHYSEIVLHTGEGS